MKIFKAASVVVCLTFLANTVLPDFSFAQDFRLPAPGVMVHLSPAFQPPVFKGIKADPNNPLRFDFILDKGDSLLSDQQLKEESGRLVNYFLAGMTVPDKDLWVNLSPYEKERIIPSSFDLTAMGRDLLGEDYILKQVTASLIYPGDAVGKKFWARVYQEVSRKFGTTDVPVNTFNKVWIVPEKSVIYENAKTATAYIVQARLKVMLEQDYLSLAHHVVSAKAEAKGSSSIGSEIIRQIVIPQLTREVNEGRNFARLRQVYNSLLLASWYKQKIKDSVLSMVYVDKNKIAGIKTNDPQAKEKIYQRYLEAFKKGVYNYINEETDSVTHENVPRKYFSGGVELSNQAMTVSQVLSSQVWKQAFGRLKHTVQIAVALTALAAVSQPAVAQNVFFTTNSPITINSDSFGVIPGTSFIGEGYNPTTEGSYELWPAIVINNQNGTAYLPSNGAYYTDYPYTQIGHSIETQGYPFNWQLIPYSGNPITESMKIAGHPEWIPGGTLINYQQGNNWLGIVLEPDGIATQLNSNKKFNYQLTQYMQSDSVTLTPISEKYLSGAFASKPAVTLTTKLYPIPYGVTGVNAFSTNSNDALPNNSAEPRYQGQIFIGPDTPNNILFTSPNYTQPGTAGPGGGLFFGFPEGGKTVLSELTSQEFFNGIYNLPLPTTITFHIGEKPISTINVGTISFNGLTYSGPFNGVSPLSPAFIATKSGFLNGMKIPQGEIWAANYTLGVGASTTLFPLLGSDRTRFKLDYPDIYRGLEELVPHKHGLTDLEKGLIGLTAVGLGYELWRTVDGTSLSVWGNSGTVGLGLRIPTDNAMSSRNGGIDLTTGNLNLQVQNKGGEIKFKLDPAMLAQLKDTTGFTSVIIGMRAMTVSGLKQFLGV